jgi:hypothetical protein
LKGVLYLGKSQIGIEARKAKRNQTGPQQSDQDQSQKCNQGNTLGREWTTFRSVGCQIKQCKIGYRQGVQEQRGEQENRFPKDFPAGQIGKFGTSLNQFRRKC